MVIDINDTKMLTKMIENTDCILIGPGLGCDFKGNNAITFLLQNIQPHQTLIVDGDAITILASLNQKFRHVTLYLRHIKRNGNV